MPIREYRQSELSCDAGTDAFPHCVGREKSDFHSESDILCRLLPHGGHLQKIVIADVKGLLVLFPDAVIDFLTIHADIFRHFKAELDLAALYLEDADSNVVANVDAFACTSAQY